NFIIALLPYMEQGPLYQNLANLSSNFTKSNPQYLWCNTATASDPVKSPGSQVLNVLLCPSDKLGKKTTVYQTYTFAYTNYGGIQGTQQDYYNAIRYPFDGLLFPNSYVTINQITDGTSNPIMLGERTYADTNPTGQAAVLAAGGWAWANYNSMQDF